MSPMTRGFTIIEMLIATLIAAAVCLGALRLFHQNERVFRDQNIVIEMQQSARAALALITDDIRLAGQSVPVYAAAVQGSIDEGSVVILEGSTSNRIQFRAGITDLDSFVLAPLPLNVAVGSTADIHVPNAAMYSAHLGTAPQGRFLYIQDPGAGWVRAQIHSISGISRTLAVTAVQASAPAVQFDAHPSLGLEEAVAIFHDTQTKSIRRASATNLSDPKAPVWNPANEIAAHVVGLDFRYYNAMGTQLPSLNTLVLRHDVERIDVEVSVQAASPLSNGTLPVYSLSQRSIPRNLAVR